MATDLERLEILIEANTKQAANAMAKLQKDTAKALNASTRSVTSLDNSLKQMGARAQRVAGILGITLGATALVSLIKKSVDAGEAIGDLSEKLGITAEQLQEFTFAAQQNGSSQEGLATAFRGMTKLLGEVERGSKTAAKELGAIGLSIADLRGKSPAEVFTILLDRIGKIEDPLRRNAELIKVFGKSGVEMAQLAMKGAAGIDQLRQRARELGLVLSNQTIKALQDAGDKIDIIKSASSVAGAKMAEAFLPAIDALAKMVTDPAFQEGMAQTAAFFGAIVKFLVEHPEIAKILAGAAVGSRFGGLPGAVVGGGAVALGEGLSAMTAPETVRHGRRGPNGETIWGDAPPGIPEITVTKGLGGSGSSGGLGGGFSSPAQDSQRKKFEDMTFALEQQLEALTKTDREQAISNELTRLGAEASEQQRGAIAALTGKLYDQKEALEASRDATRFFAETAAEAFSSLIPQIETGNQVLDTMINKLIEAGAQAFLLGEGPLANLFGGKSKSGGVGGILGSLFGGFFADGGMLGAGKYGVAGENGPELVRGPAMITPAGAGSSKPVWNINVTVNGARGNQEIQSMVSAGVQTGIAGYDKATARRQQLNA